MQHKRQAAGRNGGQVRQRALCHSACTQVRAKARRRPAVHPGDGPPPPTPPTSPPVHGQGHHCAANKRLTNGTTFRPPQELFKTLDTFTAVVVVRSASAVNQCTALCLKPCESALVVLATWQLGNKRFKSVTQRACRCSTKPEAT